MRLSDDPDLGSLRLTVAASWDDLSTRLAVAGYRFEPAGRGLVFRSADGSFIKASAVSRDASRTALETRFNETIQEYRERHGIGKEVERSEAASDPQADRPQQRESPPTVKAAEDPRTDRAQPKTPTVTDIAGKVVKSATGWRDLETRLSKEGMTLKRKGRGLVVVFGDAEIKLSTFGRDQTPAKLAERFGDDYRQFEAVKASEKPPVDQGRATEIDRATRALQQFDKDTAALAARLAERDRALRATEPTFKAFRDLAADKKAINRFFEAA